MKEKKKIHGWKTIYHIALGLPLVVSQDTGLENEIAHMNEGSSDLSPATADHPAFINHLGHSPFQFRENSSSEALCVNGDPERRKEQGKSMELDPKIEGEAREGEEKEEET